MINNNSPESQLVQICKDWDNAPTHHAKLNPATSALSSCGLAEEQFAPERVQSAMSFLQPSRTPQPQHVGLEARMSVNLPSSPRARSTGRCSGKQGGCRPWTPRRPLRRPSPRTQTAAAPSSAPVSDNPGVFAARAASRDHRRRRRSRLDGLKPNDAVLDLNVSLFGGDSSAA